MLYVDPNGNYPRFIGDIQQELPGWQIGDDLPAGWEIVQPHEPPPYNPATHRIYEEAPARISGRLNQTWAIREATSEELEMIDAPRTAHQKLKYLGFSDAEIALLMAPTGIFL